MCIDFIQRLLKIIIVLTDLYFINKANKSFVGHIGVSDAIIEVFYILVAMFTDVDTIFIARFLGAKKMDKVCLNIKLSYILVFVSSVIIFISGMVSCRSLVELLYPKLSVEDINSVLKYFRMALVSLLFEVVYYNTTGIISVLGKTRMNVIIMLCVASTNTIMDVILFNLYHCDIIGAGISTMTANMVGAIASVMYLRYILPELKNKQHMDFNECKEMTIKMIKNGLPITLSDRMVSIGNNVSTVTLSLYSTGMLSMLSIFNQFTAVMLLSINAVASTVTSSLGRCYGAQNKKAYNLTKKYLNRLFVFVGYGCLIIASIILYKCAIVYNFDDIQLSLIRKMILLHVVTVIIFGYFRYMTVKLLFTRDMTFVPSLLSVVGNVVGRIVVPIIICPIISYPVLGVRLGASAEWLVYGVLIYIYYRFTKNKLKQYI